MNPPIDRKTLESLLAYSRNQGVPEADAVNRDMSQLAFPTDRTTPTAENPFPSVSSENMQSFQKMFSGQDMNLTAPKTLEELDALVKSGQLTDENKINQYELDLSNQDAMANRGFAMGPMDSMEDQGTKGNWDGRFPALNFAGSDLSTELYSLGMFLGQKQGTPGKGLGVASSAGAALLGGARDLLGGLGYQRANNYTQDFYEKQKRRADQMYTADDQFQDNNSRGGLRLGGLFKMEDGGPVPPPMSSVANPYFKQQSKVYSMYNDPSKFSAISRGDVKKIEGAALDSWYNERIANSGIDPATGKPIALTDPTSEFVGGFKPKAVLQDESGRYYPIYDAPAKVITPPMPMTATTVPTPSTTSPSVTGSKSVPRLIKNPDGSTTTVAIPIELSQKIPGSGSQAVWTKEEWEKKIGPIGEYNTFVPGNNTVSSVPFPADYGATGELSSLTEYYRKQQPQMRDGGEKNAYRDALIEYMRRKDYGGDPSVTDKSMIGYRMPISGEALTNENQKAGIALFKNKYGDANFFAQKYNESRNTLENTPRTLIIGNNVDGTTPPMPTSTDPDDWMSTNDVSIRESARRARELNRINRQEDLGYEKIQRDAFVQKGTPAMFQGGGTIGGKKPGDYIKFKYGGEVVEGVIKRIENGKIII